ncbi:MAG: hypothetical protein K2Y21_06105 [Phycisphaerales bacterium]|nr:hypothetical protein [Phycisphaerales bacterium]
MRCWMRLVTAIVAAMAPCLALAQRSTPLRIPNPDVLASDLFGVSVAIDGDTLVVGVPFDNVGSNVDQGSANVYRWTGTDWTREATLIAPDSAANDFFGFSVAITGDTVIIGAYGDDVGVNADQGSVYLFTRAGSSWTQQAKLIASDGASGDRLGYAVAISGDTVIMGASGDDIGVKANQGSAYVFARAGSSWTQQAKLTAADGAADDNLGQSVAISGDTAIVGAGLDDAGANVDQGSAYVFVRVGPTWTQQAKLAANDGAAGDAFGSAVALTGDTAVIGAATDDAGANVDQGSAYVFVRAGSSWSQQAKLSAADGAAGDGFGLSVAISGDTAIVGANLDDIGISVDQGSAYVFIRSGTTWVQQSKLATALDGRAGDRFGSSVAISGDTAIIGAPNQDLGFLTPDQGAAWVFSRIGSTWIGPDLQLLASGGAASDNFGFSVALSGDTALVGASGDDVGANIDQGSVYVFTRSGTTWTQQAQLTATGGAAGDSFGISVALSGDTALVGANADDVGANANQGSAYIFTRSGSTWTQQAQLTASGGAANDLFGVSVALSGDTALVGAYGDDIGANTNQGSAYIFTRSGSTWIQQAQLTATGGAANDLFGVFVALSGDTALVGASADDVGANTDQGSAYIFTRSGITWTQQAQLTATGGSAGDQFGYSVALSGDTALVGANLDDVGANLDQGSAYVFTRSGTTWTQQAQLTATSGAAFDYFGITVALSGDTALVGANLDNVGANTDQGSAWTFDVPADDFSLAHNDVTDVSYPTLSAALLPATSGQQITATEAAWRQTGSLNTFGRSIGLFSSADLRTPSTAVLDLSGSSALAAATGSSVDVFGQLRVGAGASVDVTGTTFRLGSRGILTARAGSSLTINALAAALDGQTRLEQNASITFSGDVTANGPTTANLNTSLTMGGRFSNFDIFTINTGTISTPLFSNRVQTNILGDCAFFGSYTNEYGATTSIRSGTLLVFGTLTNSGTIVGAACTGCLSVPPNLDIGGDLTLGAPANLNMPFVGSQVHVGGDFDNSINANTRYDLSLATLQLEGTGSEQTLEVMSRDIGASASGLDRTIAGHYPIGTLRIGPSPSTVRLVDAYDNDNLGQGSCEAIYVDTLQIDAGSRLINPACRIYYKTLIRNGTIDVPANVIPLTAPCPADLNNDGLVDDADFSIFVVAYDILDCADPTMPPSCPADLNSDALVDDADFQIFVVAYNAVLCS